MRSIHKLSLIMMVFLLAATSTALAEQGRIIDVLQGSVTVQLNGSSPYQKGDKIELSYMAGMLEMMIGSYEVVQSQKNIFIAKEIALSMPPSNNMKVAVVKVGGAASKQEKKSEGFFFLGEMLGGKKEKVEPAIMVESKTTIPSVTTDDFSGEILGKVAEVHGRDVVIQITSGAMPKEGYLADLSFKTASGQELSVGTWKVTDVYKTGVMASPLNSDALEPKVGLKAVIYQAKHSPKTAEMPVPSIKKELFDPFADAVVVEEKPSALPVDHFGDLFADSPGAKLMEADPGGWTKVSFESYKNELLSRIGSRRNLLNEQNSFLKIYRGKYWLGIMLEPNKSLAGQSYATAPRGIRIVKVFPKSSAAGRLEVADIIYGINGVEVSSIEEFVSHVQLSNGTIQVKIDRNHQLMDITIPLKTVAQMKKKSRW